MKAPGAAALGAGPPVHNVAGTAVNTIIADALISDDDKVIYRIDDGVPVLLPEEGIGTTQFTDFPA